MEPITAFTRLFSNGMSYILDISASIFSCTAATAARSMIGTGISPAPMDHHM